MIETTALAALFAAHQIKPKYGPAGQWQPGYATGVVEQIWAGAYVDDATAKQLASALSTCVVLQIAPQSTWKTGPNDLNGTEITLCNWLAVPLGDGTYSIVSASDIAHLSGISYCVGNLSYQFTLEMILSMMIPGTTPSAAAIAALQSDLAAQVQFSTLVPTSQTVYKVATSA
jgi:hypothetical protein